MTCIKFTVFLLFLVLKLVCSEEPEPLFRAEGSNIEMGYCFGADYILVYRSTADGDRLRGNSSDKISPNEDYDHQLLGIQISNLTHMDSGIYKRECWQNQTRISQHTQELIVCNEEINAEEIKKKAEGTEILCHSASIDLEGTSVRWYSEMDPTYKPTLFLDTSLSLQPFGGNHPGVVEVRDGAARLLLNDSVFDNDQHFYCLVMKGPTCLSYQNMYPPDYSKSSEVFPSHGERVVLSCPVGDKQQWETPEGTFSASNTGNSKMHISFDEEHFSLVIPVVSEELSGHYSCISRSFEIQYMLALCPEKTSQKKVSHEKDTVSLQCNFGQGDSQQVQWYRQELAGQSERISDSHEEIPIPEDLRGRLTVTEDGSLLTITKLHVTDGRVYWCVALKGPEFLESTDDYPEDDDEEEDSDETFWADTLKCIFKQETDLIISKTGGRGMDVNPVIPGSGPPSTADPPQPADIVAYAVGAGLVGLLVVGGIVAAIIVKKRNTSATQRQAASCSGTQMDTKQDPGCTDRLTNENNA